MIERKRGCRGEEGIRERRRARGRERSWSDPECGSPKTSHIAQEAEEEQDIRTSGEVWGGNGADWNEPGVRLIIIIILLLPTW